LQSYFQLYNYLFLVAIIGPFLSLCLALMVVQGTCGVELALVISFVGVFGLAQLLVPPWLATTTDEEDLYYFPSNANPSNDNSSSNKPKVRLLTELAVDTTRIIGTESTRGGASSLVCPTIKDSTSSCSICLQCFEVGQKDCPVVTVCQHTFHSRCLETWVQKSATCPHCRQDLEKVRADENEEDECANDTRHMERRKLFEFLDALLVCVMEST